MISLEQRRRIQLLSLMYKKSTDITMHKTFPRNTRMSNRTVFKTDNKEGSLHKQSPYFVGAKLWDSPNLSIIVLPDMFSFKKRLNDMNKVYVDLW